MTSGLLDPAVDRHWLHFFNGLIGSSAERFDLALLLSDRLPWILFALGLCAIWYSGTPGLIPKKPGGLLRIEARRMALLSVALLPFLFVISKLIQSRMDVLRPFAHPELISVPIQPAIWHEVIATLPAHGSFPSDHAVVFFFMAVVSLGVNRWLGFLAMASATVFSLLRIALGFHWPSDILGGALLGGLAGMMVLLVGRYSRDYLIVTPPKEAIQVLALAGYFFLLDFSGKFSVIMWLLDHLKEATHP